MSGWRKITCDERDALYNERREQLCVLAGRTDMGGMYGDPEIFTEWGDRETEQPVLRDRRFPPQYPIPPLADVRLPDTKPCEHYRYESPA